VGGFSHQPDHRPQLYIYDMSNCTSCACRSHVSPRHSGRHWALRCTEKWSPPSKASAMYTASSRDIPDLLRGWYPKPGAWERVTCWGKLKETRITLEETPAASWRCVRRRHIPTVVSYGRCCKPLAKLPILS